MPLLPPPLRAWTPEPQLPGPRRLRVSQAPPRRVPPGPRCRAWYCRPLRQTSSPRAPTPPLRLVPHKMPRALRARCSLPRQPISILQRLPSRPRRTVLPPLPLLPPLLPPRHGAAERRLGGPSGRRPGHEAVRAEHSDGRRPCDPEPGFRLKAPAARIREWDCGGWCSHRRANCLDFGHLNGAGRRRGRRASSGCERRSYQSSAE